MNVELVEQRQEDIEYRDIPGSPGYRVGDDGSVWSFRKHIYRPEVDGCNCVCGPEWRRLKGYLPNQYFTVKLPPGKNRFVHRLVLEAFVGPRPEGMVARHFPDNDPTNNRLSNLRWDTPEANVADRAIHDTDPRGERNPKCKLTAEQVRSIRADAARGVRNVDLARKYLVTPEHIWAIVRRKYWTHLD